MALSFGKRPSFHLSNTPPQNKLPEVAPFNMGIAFGMHLLTLNCVVRFTAEQVTDI